MTTFRLNAGRTATYSGSGSSALPPVPETPRKVRPWSPNDGSEDAHLACGDTIPWPVIQVFGGNLHGQVHCSEHGYQPRITKTEIAEIRRRAKEGMKQCPNQDELQIVPF